MKIQALNSVNANSACQPIKSVNFERRKSPDLQTPTPVQEDDSFTPSNDNTLAQKYDFACRVAAYYKTQYEQLLNGGCEV